MIPDLEQFGLTKNESAIYTYLLKKGSTTTGAIIKNTGIANSRIYNSLNSLLTKGLVSYTIQKEGKHFQAVDPKKLMEIEDERKQKLVALIPQLQNLKNLEQTDTTSAIYEGFEGFKTAFKKIIDDCPKDGVIHILGFSEQQFGNKSLRTFITNMNLKSAEKKQRLRILMDQSVKATSGKDRQKEKYTEIRYMPKGYISPAAIDIFGDYVYIFLWEEKPFVFMIKNKTIAESFRIYFQFLWNMGKE
jgi:HTH-type transcriptional regulator, sugar sensing transcriptional regulator